MRVTFSSLSKKNFSKLNPRIQQKIVADLNKFSRGERVDMKKIKNSKNEFRIRAGNFRIQFEKHENEILITKIGKRENFYAVFL
jgi:mRNA-degrading endonuclease RelE of RelBE toxin-antitoxin system